MSKGNTFENEFLEHVFNNADIPLIGDAAGLRGSSTAGSLYVALHTADPTETGTQTSFECAYTGYAREAITRAGGGFVVTGNSVSPAANVDFGEKTAGGDETATYFTIGTASSGAGKVLYRGTLTPNISIVNGTIPRIKSTSTITED